MLKTLSTTFALSASLAAGAALAQTSPTTPAPTPPMSTTAPATPAATPTTASASSGSFVTDQKAGEFRASKFVGVDIYGSENQKIGDVNEILMDASGSAKAIVIGVGGFLGIGEKNVAIPFSAVEWKNERMAADRPATTAATTPAATSAPSTMSTTTGTTAGTPMSTGATATTAAVTRSPAETAAANGYPDHGMIKMTRADLQNAPTFKYYAEANTTAATTTSTPAVPPPAPRQ